MTPETFRAWRRRLCLSINEAGEALGISRDTIYRYERGESAITRITALACAAVALGIKPHE